MIDRIEQIRLGRPSILPSCPSLVLIPRLGQLPPIHSFSRAMRGVRVGSFRAPNAYHYYESAASDVGDFRSHTDKNMFYPTQFISRSHPDSPFFIPIQPSHSFEIGQIPSLEFLACFRIPFQFWLNCILFLRGLMFSPLVLYVLTDCLNARWLTGHFTEFLGTNKEDF